VLEPLPDEAAVGPERPPHPARGIGLDPAVAVRADEDVALAAALEVDEHGGVEDGVPEVDGPPGEQVPAGVEGVDAVVLAGDDDVLEAVTEERPDRRRGEEAGAEVRRRPVADARRE